MNSFNGDLSRRDKLIGSDEVLRLISFITLVQMHRNQREPVVKQLRDLDFNSIDKPKTLVILHYNGRRISVPLFKQVFDFAPLLYHHISTLQQKILSHDPDWQKKAQQQIVCFQIKKDPAPDKITDGDLKSDLVLSLLRIEKEQSLEELELQIDVTKIYKYLEIQPYYRYFEKKVSHYTQPETQRAPYLTFYRIVAAGNNSNVYLARRITDGYFFAVRVYAESSKVGLSEARVIEHLNYIDEQGSQIKCSLIVRYQQVIFIPHPQAESEEEEDNAESCRYIAVISPYCVRGSLQDLLNQARFGRRRVGEMDCLNYLKELMWGVHILHQKYNLVHRALSPSNIFIDQNGFLKLCYFAFCVPCFDSQMNYAQYLPKTKYPKAGFSLEELVEEDDIDIEEYSAPELIRGQFYNYLVDFYSVGVIVRKLYEQSQALERAPVSQNNQNLMMAMIDKLTSPDLEERASIVREILEDIAKEDLESDHQLQIPNLSLQDIKVGRIIETSSSKKFIENEEKFNGIDHDTIFNFFKEPIKTKTSKIKRQRKVSKDKTGGRNSREKSQKCLSKVSENVHDTSQSKKRKISNAKNRSFNSSNNPHETSKDSKDKKNIQKQSIDSPAKRKANKSRSQEKTKKDPLACTKLYTHHDETKKVLVVPKSPKGTAMQMIPHRPKSPGMREAKR